MFRCCMVLVILLSGISFAADYGLTPPGTDTVLTIFNDVTPSYSKAADSSITIETNVAKYVLQPDNGTIACWQKIGLTRENLLISFTDSNVIETAFDTSESEPGYKILDNDHIRMAFHSDGTMWVHVYEPGITMKMESKVSLDYDKGGDLFEMDSTDYPISSVRIVKTNWMVVTDDGSSDGIACTGGFGVYCRSSVGYANILRDGLPDSCVDTVAGYYPRMEREDDTVFVQSRHLLKSDSTVDVEARFIVSVFPTKEKDESILDTRIKYINPGFVSGMTNKSHARGGFYGFPSAEELRAWCDPTWTPYDNVMDTSDGFHTYCPVGDVPVPVNTLVIFETVWECLRDTLATQGFTIDTVNSWTHSAYMHYKTPNSVACGVNSDSLLTYFIDTTIGENPDLDDVKLLIYVSPMDGYNRLPALEAVPEGDTAEINSILQGHTMTEDAYYDTLMTELDRILTLYPRLDGFYIDTYPMNGNKDTEGAANPYKWDSDIEPAVLSYRMMRDLRARYPQKTFLVHCSQNPIGPVNTWADGSFSPLGLHDPRHFNPIANLQCDICVPFVDRYADILRRGEWYPISIETEGTYVKNHVSDFIKYVANPTGISNCAGSIIWDHTTVPLVSPGVEYPVSYYETSDHVSPVSLGASRQSDEYYFRARELTGDDRKWNRLIVTNKIYDNYILPGYLIMDQPAEEHIYPTNHFDRRLYLTDTGPDEGYMSPYSSTYYYRQWFGPYDDYFQPAAAAWAKVSTADFDSALYRGYFSFDENSGDTVRDSSVFNNYGILHGADWYTAGTAGSALEFDAGNTDSVVFPNSSDDFNFGTSDFSLEAWVYFNTVPAGVQYLVNKGASGGPGYGITMRNGRLSADIRGASGSDQWVNSAATALSAGLWHHVAAVYDRDKAVFVYLDGALADSAIFYAGNTTSVNNDSDLVLGCYITGNTGFYTGCLNEMKIYDRVLAAEEVAAHYSLNDSAALALYFPFDAGSGTSVKDWSSYGNDGIFVDNPVRVAGLSGNALSFDGVDDSVSVPDDASLDVPDALTISLWMKLDADFSTSDNYPIMKGGYLQSNYRMWARCYSGSEDTNRVGFYAYSSGAKWFNLSDRSYGLSVGEWYHVALSFNTAFGGQLYINGQPVGGRCGRDSVLFSTAGGVCIGDGLDGEIDELKIFRRGLSDEEIGELYREHEEAGLYLNLDFNDASGSTAPDSGIYGRDGVVNGATPVSIGIDGGAMEFDGSNDYIDLDAYKGIGGTHSRTVSCWIKTDDEINHGIITWGDIDAEGAYWNFKLNHNALIGSVGALRVDVANGFVIGETVISDDTWHYVAAVLDEDDDPNVTDVTLYVDGVEDGLSGYSSKEIDTDISSDNLYIGRSAAAGGGGFYYFEGFIDEVRIYGRALNEFEIWGHYIAYGDTIPPDVPDGLDATPDDGLVKLKWDPCDSVDVNYYKIYRRKSSEANYTVIAEVDTEYCEDITVQNDTTYFYFATAVDFGQNESDTSFIQPVSPQVHWKSVILTPGIDTLSIENLAQGLTAYLARSSGADTVDKTDSVTWIISDDDIITVDDTGLAHIYCDTGNVNVIAAWTNELGANIKDTCKIYVSHVDTIKNTTCWNRNFTFTGDVVVAAGCTLTVDTGTVVTFLADADSQHAGLNAGKSELIVLGVLNAVGTPGDSVVFTSGAATPQGGDWYGINQAAGYVNMKYCRVEYPEYGVRSGYYANAAVIENSLFYGCGQYGVYEAALYADVTVDSCRFTGFRGSSAYGVAVNSAAGTDRITNNVIDDFGAGTGSEAYGIHVQNDYTVVAGNTVNDFTDGVGYGIYLYGCAYDTVRDNVINQTGQTGSGIYLSGVTNSRIVNNAVYNCNDYGIYCNNATVDIDSNLVADCPDWAAGVYVTGASGSPDISGNTVKAVTGNQSSYAGIAFYTYANGTVRNNRIEDFAAAGIYCQALSDGDAIDCGTAGDPGMNDVYWNLDDAGSVTGTYLVANSCSDTVTAAGNFFGPYPDTGDFYGAVRWDDSRAVPTYNTVVLLARVAGTDTDTLHDAGMFANHAPLNGGMSLVTGGVSDTALLADGVDGYGNLGQPNSLSGLNNFSVSVWIRTSEKKTMYIIGRDGGYNGYNRCWALHTHGDKGVNVFKTYKGYDLTYMKGVTDIADTAWHHIVGVNYDDSLRLYVDGQLDSVKGTTDDCLDDLDEDIKVCRRNKNGGDNYWDGWLDELSIHDYALAAAAVGSLYAEFSGGLAKRGPRGPGTRESLSGSVRLASAVPNPSAGPVTVRYAVPMAARALRRVRLRVFGLDGTLLRTLVDGKRISGREYLAVWDAAGGDGPVDGGVFWYELAIDGDVLESGRIIIK